MKNNFIYVKHILDAKGPRNKMIHDYMGVAIEVVCGICEEDLPELKKVIIQAFNV